MIDLFSKIKEVTELDGIAGYEHTVRDYLRAKITPLVDRVEVDGLGGIFGIRESKADQAPRILVAAHMDEVGFMVSEIKADGTLRVVEIGGWNPLVVSSQRFTLYTRTGQAIPVISGSVPPHFLRGANGAASLPAVSDIVFDGGFTDKTEAESFGITPGDIIVPQSETILTANKKNIISKAWDNRYGVLMVTELLEALKDQTLHNTLIAGANVQEEVGLRGAHVSATTFDPELFFAVDCSPAGDIYGNPGHIGDGTLLRFYDPGHIMLKNMRDFLLTTAEEAGVAFQYYCGKGGTDAGAAHLKNGGIPSTTIGVCARYIHSHQSLYALDDFVEAQAFLQAIVKRLDRSTVDLIKKY
ncbi:glutamyl aminopeptidase [Streptococcus equi subsp. zooepidemicus]|uniref:glutamyl aminopeptidase n=1 Tax=Streptococcus equi TaxID=1336 RepID=UPI001E3A8449|nr:glutamyl aminopeptidase [Streptococcus equi]MCD3389595.1 glutamyl aminopeptidase [Streptococcus equi subsp. zooepidemicus]HEL0632003.1 glutamyl aminopeptidase [Streptococcus equi subsp. zooepidemicus]HEL0683769.1 glutamyl aminopeptidase [Streptococcus equi subsp. zooepidemicus]